MRFWCQITPGFKFIASQQLHPTSSTSHPIPKALSNDVDFTKSSYEGEKAMNIHI